MKNRDLRLAALRDRRPKEKGIHKIDVFVEKGMHTGSLVAVLFPGTRAAIYFYVEEISKIVKLQLN